MATDILTFSSIFISTITPPFTSQSTTKGKPQSSAKFPGGNFPQSITRLSVFLLRNSSTTLHIKTGSDKLVALFDSQIAYSERVLHVRGLRRRLVILMKGFFISCFVLGFVFCRGQKCAIITESKSIIVNTIFCQLSPSIPPTN